MSALLALTLTGCASSGAIPKPRAAPPPIPAGIEACLKATTPPPKAGPMTKADVFALVAKLKKSEAAKTACGKRLILFYETIMVM